MSTPTRPPPGETSTSYHTPTKRAAFAEAGPSRLRPQGASPAYSSRRHSLYGIEDRIVIDPGSRIWKVGFSGEPHPRASFWSTEPSERDQGITEAWELDLGKIANDDRVEGSRVVGVRVLKRLRETFTRHLMTDSKSRKVLVLENTYLPSYVKERIAAALFDNLQAPSVSFTSSPVLALAACGRITGLVVDCGWLETTITPVYHSRPLYHLARSIPLAGRNLHHRLKALLRHHAIYYPPPSSLHRLERSQMQPVPIDILTDDLLERVKKESCFVGDPMRTSFGDWMTPPTEDDVNMDSVLVTNGDLLDIDNPTLMDLLRDRYSQDYRCKDIHFKIPLSPGQQGSGTVVVPGWIRERAAEVLFGDHLGEEESIPEAILACLLKLPVDLRPIMISIILVTGGTAMLPGFIPRLKKSLYSILEISKPDTSDLSSPASSIPIGSPEYRKIESQEWKKRHNKPFASLYGLQTKLAILNDPNPLDSDSASSRNAGKAPRWVPSLLNWVGGSLAGALKTGGPELLREDYDHLSSEALQKAENWRESLDIAQAEMAALVGVDIETLKPGMGLDCVDRKRGWSEGVLINDWTRVVPAGSG